MGPGRCVAAPAAAPTLSATTAQPSQRGSGIDGGLRELHASRPPLPALPAARRDLSTYTRQPRSAAERDIAASQVAGPGSSFFAGGAPIVAGPKESRCLCTRMRLAGRCGACSAHALLLTSPARWATAGRAGARSHVQGGTARSAGSQAPQRPAAPAEPVKLFCPRPRRQPCDPQALDQGQVRCLGRPGRRAGTSAAAATAVGALPA